MEKYQPSEITFQETANFLPKKRKFGKREYSYRQSFWTRKQALETIDFRQRNVPYDVIAKITKGKRKSGKFKGKTLFRIWYFQ